MTDDDLIQRHAAFHLLEGCCRHPVYADVTAGPDCCFCDLKFPCDRFLENFGTWQAEREARLDEFYRTEERAAMS